VEWESTGTRISESAGTATNNQYQLRGVSVGRLDATGKIAENRDYYNPADLIRQPSRSARTTAEEG
jgi:hypothetical protein